MLSDHVLRQLAHDRGHELELQARKERLAATARIGRRHGAIERRSAALLGFLLAARRQATT
jgi:hypothetical protein